MLPGERDGDGRLKMPHTCYGLCDNVIYVLRRMWRYGRILIPLYLVAAVTKSVVQYAWVFLGKFLIEIVQAQAGTIEKDLQPLYLLTAAIAFVEILGICGNTVIMQLAGSKSLYVRHRLLSDLNAKSLRADYQMFEQPHILNMFQEERIAVNDDGRGIGAMLRRILTIRNGGSCGSLAAGGNL